MLLCHFGAEIEKTHLEWPKREKPILSRSQIQPVLITKSRRLLHNTTIVNCREHQDQVSSC